MTENLPAEPTFPCISILDAVFTTDDRNVVSDETRDEANLLLCSIETLGGAGSEW